MTASHAMAVGGSRTASRGTVFVLVVLTALLVIMQTAYRTTEIRLADVFIGLFDQHTRVDPSGPTIYFGLGTPKALGLTMTPECTSAFLILPLLVVGAIMIALRPRITRRVVFALAISAVVLILVNQFRLVALVVLVHLLGTDRGYYWGHTLGGSMVSVFGGAVALVLFVWIATRKSKPERDAAKQARTAAARDEG
ncbi:MAG: exosortase P [Actinomycetota bacterium]|nr:exosortase P [Actinomycetota bacterium]